MQTISICIELQLVNIVINRNVKRQIISSLPEWIKNKSNDKQDKIKSILQFRWCVYHRWKHKCETRQYFHYQPNHAKRRIS